jgi:hypothetical protein
MANLNNGLLLHSVSYSGSWGQPVLTLDDFVDKAADLGFDGVMLMAKRPHLSVLDYGPKECPRLRQRIESRPLLKVCIDGTRTSPATWPIPIFRIANFRFNTSPDWPAWPAILAPARFASSADISTLRRPSSANGT